MIDFYTLRNALTQLVKYAQILEENIPNNQGLSRKPALSEEEAETLFNRALLKASVPVEGNTAPLFELFGTPTLDKGGLVFMNINYEIKE